MKFKRLEDMVRVVLATDPATRDDDRLLALKVWQAFYGVSSWASVSEVLLNDKLPTIESIGRVRRKIQETTPELRGTERVRRCRRKQEQEIREYVKEA